MLIAGSSKTYTHNAGLSCCFRQWRAKSHCNMWHGYALQIEVEFEGVLDDKNWIVDFGSLKKFKQQLEYWFDHTMAVAKDDPELEFVKLAAAKGLCDLRIMDSVGCEAFAKMIFNWLTGWLERSEYQNRQVSVRKVVVREHAGNSGYARRLDV